MAERFSHAENNKEAKWLPVILDDICVLAEDESVHNSKGNCSCSSVSLHPEQIWLYIKKNLLYTHSLYFYKSEEFK